MVRDLVELSVNMIKSEEQERVKIRAAELAEERLLDLLLPPKPTEKKVEDMLADRPPDAEQEDLPLPVDSTREKIRRLLNEGKLDSRSVEIEIQEVRPGPMIEIFSSSGVEDMGLNIKEMFGNIFPQKKRVRKVKVPEAIELLTHEEAQRLVDMDKVTKTAVERVEESGIIFLDEIDKIVGSDGAHGPDVSREGVQRDLLPIVEGSNVNTRYGMVRSYPFHCGGGLQLFETVRSDPGTSGAVSHPGRVGFARKRRIHPDPDGTP
jgi:ATP-dependent HslUV protease ATP-binding subunit HslU